MVQKSKGYLQSRTVLYMAVMLALSLIAYVTEWTRTDTAWNWREFIFVLSSGVGVFLGGLVGRRFSKDSPLRLRSGSGRGPGGKPLGLSAVLLLTVLVGSVALDSVALAGGSRGGQVGQVKAGDPPIVFLWSPRQGETAWSIEIESVIGEALGVDSFELSEARVVVRYEIGQRFAAHLLVGLADGGHLIGPSLTFLPLCGREDWWLLPSHTTALPLATETLVLAPEGLRLSHRLELATDGGGPATGKEQIAIIVSGRLRR